MEPHLHNKIFDSIHCLSEEQLLKYGNNSLSKKERHRVEKHLLECELCTDALEGFALVPASDEINEVRNRIQHISSIGKPVSINQWKRFLLAASILGIVFVSFYFIFQKNKIAERKSLAGNIHTETKIPLEKPMAGEPESAPVDEKNNKTIFENTATKEENKQLKMTMTGANLNEIKNNLQSVISDNLADKNQGATGKDGIPIDAEVAVADMPERETLEEPEGEFLTKETRVENKKEEKPSFSTDKYVQEEKKNLSRAEGNQRALDQTIAPAEDENTLPVSKAAASEEEDLSKNYRAASLKNRKKADESAMAGGKTAPSKKANEKPADSEVKYIQDFKVLEYSGEINEISSPETINTPAQFENSEASKKAEADAMAKTKTLPYDGVLKEGLDLIERGKYNEAIEKFNLILKNNPADLNAIFYSGIAWYNLENYDKALANFNVVTASSNSAFYDEGNWYKALTYQQKNEMLMARALFREISTRENFYKKRASEMLDKMEKK